MRNRRLLAAFWTLGVLAGLLIPGRFLYGASRTAPHVDLGVPVDKVIHVTMFAGFVVVWAWAGSPRPRLPLVILVGLALGVATELAQSLPFVDRGTDINDFLIDVLGLAIGVVIASWAQRRGRLGFVADPAGS